MRRRSMTVLALAAIPTGAFAGIRGIAAAQDATPAPDFGTEVSHPVVGA